jgi:dienelactone hydrolase
LEEQDTHKAAVIFHPKAIKVAQFKANLFSTEAKEPDAVTQEAKRQKIAAQQEEQCKDMDHELAVLAEIQKGTHEVESAAGATPIRILDLKVFRDCLKRKHEESGVTATYDAIM